MLFVYNCNPLATMPDQNRVLEGLQREDLFTVVFEQVFTDTARYADVVLPATTFLENYDIAKGYGPISLQLVRPVIEPVGEARPNPEVFSDLADRLGLGERGGGNRHAPANRAAGCRQALGAELIERGVATPPFGGAPIQFVDVFPLTPDQQDRPVPRRRSTRGAGRPLRLSSPTRPPSSYPLALISPASEKTISSTLGELRAARRRCCRCTRRTPQARGLAHRRSGARLQRPRRGAVPGRRERRTSGPGTVALPKGLWRKSTFNGSTSNALVARHADRSRRRRVLQRRARAGGVAGAALSAQARAQGSKLWANDARVGARGSGREQP